MHRPARPYRRSVALAVGLCAVASARATAQVPADSARRDTTARAASPDSAAAAPARVRHLTDAGAQLRAGSSLYRVRVIAPVAAVADSAAGLDTMVRRGSLVRRDTMLVRADTPMRGDSLVGRDTVPVRADTLMRRDSLGAPRPDTVARRQADTTDLGVRTSTISPAVYGGNAAWLIVSAGGRGGQSALDSLYLAQGDLRALHLGGSLGLTRIAAEFTPDTLFAATSAPMGRRSLIAAMPPDALVSAEQLEALLQVAPLQTGWTDSVHVALIAPPTVSADSGVVQVEGSERAGTPLGPADCWVVVLRTVRGEQRLWVTKDTRTVVLARQSLSHPAGGTLERVLIAWAPPAMAQPASAPPSAQGVQPLPEPAPPNQAPAKVPAQAPAQATPQPVPGQQPAQRPLR